jgi:putative DNA primase/helicase
MTARAIILGLGGSWHGSYGMAHCPAHEDRQPSLSVRDGDGRVLVKCYAGCEFAIIRAALVARGLWPGDPAKTASPTAKAAEVANEHVARERHEAVARIWRECDPLEGTVADRYLTSRGITIPRPSCLRFNPALRHAPSDKDWPALVAAVVDVTGHGQAIHRTYLTPHHQKANVPSPKMALGPLRGCAVRLGPVAEHIGLCEGIETGLSIMQLYGLPVWAALGPHGDKVVLPPEVRRVTVFGDNGDAGHEIASRTAAAIHRGGHPVDLAFPPPEHSDFNDALVALDRISA